MDFLAQNYVEFKELFQCFLVCKDVPIALINVLKSSQILQIILLPIKSKITDFELKKKKKRFLVN